MRQLFQCLFRGYAGGQLLPGLAQSLVARGLAMRAQAQQWLLLAAGMKLFDEARGLQLHDRFRLLPGEKPVERSVRFRTLGCYPLSGAVESEATTLSEVVQEMLLTTTSERQGRAIDHDQAASMEKKKQEGYF